MSHNDQLYTVTQLGAELGITVRTLHFYEAQGLISPRRAGTTRVYSQRDRARMILILRGKRLGFSIKEIKEYLELYDIDPSHGQQTKALLKAAQNRIHKLEEQRHALEQTLTELRSIELQCEEALEKMGHPSPPALNTKPKTGQAKKAAAKPIGRSP
ncbi:MerR family transcriptional regulator [Acidocella aminolytica]|jgi:DNA-binding transcriptional MerR regulator|uniref:Transcriptional regulator MerR n=1 Tax=Acidocella aminolytica 101 = DSM 11237 TaxID=1120923 RepID=A0A0D6PAD5_9PROT|nr:MerR family DNA-binding transcriptional regulator [Acidocella aminolytica]GAN78710.1 transcriptional regulator MerR [Acidocella aminolytica 101 = DSM 11237]GBQ33893.1 putative transcriptional regulator [Acidocella aminolytica 101 = DSM 11237]SHE36011.1 DNA-binding transcriptional regulator, MerR family [Acidocella aminolytica 101 = DSM 11237]